MSVDKQDLDTAYGRRENDPIVSGDKLLMGHNSGGKWTEVVSYKWKGSRNPRKERKEQDYYTVETNEVLQDLTAAEAEACSREQGGLRPALRLETDRVHPVDEAARLRLKRFLRTSLFSYKGRPVNAEDIFSLIREKHYDIWLVGGAVRDTLYNASKIDEAREMDVDVAGTVPFHKLWKLVEKFELEASLSPDKTVCTLRTLLDRKIVIEYAPLKKAYGGGDYDFDHDLLRDCIWRDLSMNCLFYESDKQWIFDPTGEGTVLLRPIDLVKTGPPGHAATKLFRLLYFVHRKEFRGEFTGADLEHARQFISSSGGTCLNDFAERDPRVKGRTGRLWMLNKFYKKLGIGKLKPEREAGWPQLKQVCDALTEGLWDRLKPLCDEVTFDESD